MTNLLIVNASDHRGYRIDFWLIVPLADRVSIPVKAGRRAVTGEQVEA